MELSKREDAIKRARYLMKHYGYDALSALNIAEQEILEQEKKENEGC